MGGPVLGSGSGSASSSSLPGGLGAASGKGVVAGAGVGAAAGGVDGAAAGACFGDLSGRYKSPACPQAASNIVREQSSGRRMATVDIPAYRRESIRLYILALTSPRPVKTHRLESTPSAVILEPASRAEAAVIWLHGLGADGHDFVPIAPELNLPPTLAVRFFFPHAPVRPVTINNGMAMRAWYDILSLTSLQRADESGIRESERMVHGWLEEQKADGIPASRIVLAGFSQGGAIALHTGLRYPERLAGLLALSTYLPLSDLAEKEVRRERSDTPILMCHGQFDPMLPMVMGQHSRDALLNLGYAIEWHEYPMQHQVCAEEIEDIGRWLRGVLQAC